MNTLEQQAEIRTLSAQLRGAMADAVEEQRASLLRLPLGLHHNVPHDAYHERLKGLVSRTALDVFDRSPAHYKAWVDGLTADEDSAALTFGIALHCALLEPSVFARTYAVAPDFGDCRKKENKAERDKWRRENAGKKHITAADDEAITGMVAAVREHPFASRMLLNGGSEVTAIWEDEATGLRCKARADYYVPELRLIVDVKTTQDARSHAFERDVGKWGYHKQAALYRDGFAACGAPIDLFVFLCVEKAPPYAVARYALDVASTARGREQVRETMRQLAECIHADHFPGYSTDIQTISAPPWA